MKFNPRYCSHFPVLVKVLSVTKGTVLEVGMGPFSTPIMHWLCFDQGRKLISLDSNEEFIQLNRRFASEKHEIHLIKNWDDFDFNRKWDVVFVDNERKMRASVIKKIANNTNYVIIHDSEEYDYYHIDEIFPLFKYRYDYSKAVPNTTVLSNKKDLLWLKKND